MNWEKISDLNTWGDVGIELLWKCRPSKVFSPKPSWPPGPLELDDVIIRWPTEYQYPLHYVWVDSLLNGFRKFVKVEFVKLPQPRGILLIQIKKGANAYDIAIDCTDGLDFINEYSARHCLLYFKMQYSSKGYALPNILPGGYVPYNQDIYKYLPFLRTIRNKRKFLYDVYGRFGIEFTKDVKLKMIEIFSNLTDVKHAVNSIKVRYSRFLREVAQSKICIDLPGNGDFCFRLIDYFAIGSCVISLRHRTVFNVPLVERKHIVYMKDDLSDLMDLCHFYLNNDKEREAICQNSRDFFDAYLHREQLALYYIYKFLEILN